MGRKTNSTNNNKSNLTKKQKNEIDKKVYETEIAALQKEILFYKQKVSELNSKLKASYIDDVFENKVVQAIERKSIILSPLKPVYKRSDNRRKDKEVVVLNLSDIHFGEKVSKEETGDLNEYDMNIAKRRIRLLTERVLSVVEILRNAYNLIELRIYGLGDFLNGLIHTELVETADGDLIDWLYDGAMIISEMILEFAAYFKNVIFIGVVGNHGEIRRNGKKPFKRRYVNWDYIIYKNIEFMCQKERRVKFIIPKSFFYVDEIFNYKFLLIHGDSIRSWFGIPWYGIQRAVKNFKELLITKGDLINYVCLGHFHNTGMLQTINGEILLNGSVIGGNEYSIGKLVQSNSPYQLLFGVHKNKGITFRYNIKLGDNI